MVRYVCLCSIREGLFEMWPCAGRQTPSLQRIQVFGPIATRQLDETYAIPVVPGPTRRYADNLNVVVSADKCKSPPPNLVWVWFHGQ